MSDIGVAGSQRHPGVADSAGTSETSRQIHYRVHRAMAWCGVGLMVLMLCGMTLAGIFPFPVRADWSAERLAQFYGEHPNLIRAGIILAAVGLSLLGPLTVVISHQLRRIPNVPDALADLQRMGGTTIVVILVVSLITMNTAAFRPDRDPSTIMALNDLGWLLFITPISLFFMQEMPIAVAILLDDRGDPVFPRWVAYSNLFVPFSFFPALLATFFKSGPVAWQGILVYYLGLITFGAWVIIMTWATLRALRLERLS